jgi:Transcriptional accessory protein
MDQALQSYLARIVPTVPAKSAQSVIELAAEGATVPFIARYRKEKTGNLDEVQIRAVIEGHETFNEIIKRKAFLVKEISEQGNLTADVQKRIEISWDLGELEEIYKPFKKKKKTKATIARDAGLEPLANWIWDVGHGTVKDDMTMEMKAKNFLNPTAKIVTYEDALKGSQDIIVEKIANDVELRSMVSKNYMEKGRVIAKAAKGYKPNSKFEMYKEFEEPAKALLDSKNNHRYLAMRRGWQEEELSVDVKADDEDLLKSYEKFATSTPDTSIGEYLKQSARLALNVYVLPSVVNEVHRMLKEKADSDAITVFAENVRKLLLASPYGPKCVLGVDPGLRTGCKVALIDKGGAFISHTVLYTLGDDAEKKAKVLFGEVFKQIQIEAIAVGNGTAGRETESFLRKVLKDLGKNTPVVMVNESGASVYSASDIARTEFPDLDLTVKGAISIARRLQDPLAELVKVDPKSIGVGQYQHDVNQSQLKKSLEAVVESCVNNVGVDVNTASAPLLSHVAGIGPALANGIVEHRKKGLFTDRSELLKVPKFSAKVYEQAAGFLRIPTGKQVLDSTGIHPERYAAVTDMAKDLGVSLSEIIGEGAKKLVAQRSKWAQLVGEFTFDDIVKELEKPGRDPRDPFKVFQYRDDIMEVKDLKEGMICPGIVTNVTNFGAFVDIGVHQDGLVHISALSHKFVDDPRKVVNPGDHVTVKVMKVDPIKNQISLTMKMDDAPEAASAPRGEKRADAPRGGARAPVGATQVKGGGTRPPLNTGARSSHGGGGMNGGAGKPAGNPFNNPFAALLNNNNKK